MTADEFAPTPKLDAHALTRALAERAGVLLTVDGPCPGGEVGASYVRWPDGRRSVLTTGSRHAQPLLAAARAAGVPVADYLLTADLDGVHVIVQELLPGAPPAIVDQPLLDAMLAINDRLAGLLADQPQHPAVPLYLRASGPGFCLHEPLRAHSRRAARLLDQVRDIGAGIDTADGADLVHVDFHPGNILVHDQRITGVIDWDGAGRGDRHLDLVTLRCDVELRAPHLGARFDGLLTDTIPADRLQAYWAHMSLRLVDWSIRHHTPADVERWLDLADRHL